MSRSGSRGRTIHAGCHVVDNSSAFRGDPNVPLVVPEISGELSHRAGPGARLIANPNCSTIIMLLALEPLRKAFGVERIVVSTYQAVSGGGGGRDGGVAGAGRGCALPVAAVPRVFREQCAFNVFSHNSAVDAETGLNGEEAKMIR